MKNSVIFFSLFLTLASFSLSAQKTNTWKGGTPGHENEWTYFKNWSLGKTPDVFDAVVIPDVSTTTRCYPVVSAGEIEVQSLEVQSGATLVLNPSARILAERFVCVGACKGCEWKVIVEGTEKPVTASAEH